MSEINLVDLTVGIGDGVEGLVQGAMVVHRCGVPWLTSCCWNCV